MSDPPEVQQTSVTVSGREVVVSAPEPRRWVRSPQDVLRLIVTGLAVLLSVGLLSFAQRTSQGLTEDANQLAGTVPEFISLSTYAVFGVVSSLVPLALLVWVLVRRRWRLLGLYILSTAVVNIVFGLLTEQIERRVPPVSDRIGTLPAWTADFVWDPGGMASLAAFLVISGAWMSRRWRRTAWGLLLAVIPAEMLIGLEAPTGLLVGLAGGWFVGTAILLIFGTPERNPTPEDVVRALDDAGIELLTLERAAVDARGSTPYFAVGTDQRRYFVKVLGVDERSADLMFRVYRWIRLEGVGDERPFSSLRRTVEHEALVSAMAEREGVRTPSIVAPVALEDGSMALVYELVAGRSLDKVDPEEWSESLLPGVLEQVAILRTHRIAHRDLRLANVFLTDQGEPMVIDFGFGEVAADEALLDQDVAQIVVSSAVRLGANRAVSDAVMVLGPDVVARAAPRMQPLALAGATQSALKKNKHLLDEIYTEVVSQTSLDRVEPVKIERVKPRTLIMTALIFGAVWILIPQFADLPRILQQVRGADWSWAVPAIVFSMATYVGAAMALSASVPHRLSVARSTLVTLGGSFVNRISPAKVGGIALNMRYLQKQGNDTAVAASSVALYQGVGAVVHLSLLLVFGIWAGRTVSFTEFLPSGTIIFVASAVILVVIGVLIAVPKVRVAFRTYVRPQLSSIRGNFVSLLHSPGRFVVMVVGSAILTLSYIGALWASIQAFGGGVSIAGIAVVFLAGASIASAAPTPGGIGAVEAALVAGLTALGLASAVAVPAVFLYRLATFWVPVLPGWIGFTILQRREYI